MSYEELVKKMDTPLNRTRAKKIRDYMSHFIYVNPKLFRTLIQLNIAIPEKDLEKGKHPYIVFTKPYHQPAKPTIDIFISEQNAKALKQLLKNSPQRMFPGRNGILYSKGKLAIDGIRISMESNNNRALICKFLFGWGHKKSKKQGISFDLLDAKLVKPENDQDYNQYNYYRNHVRAINKEVYEISGIPHILKIDKSHIYLNPVYAS